MPPLVCASAEPVVVRRCASNSDITCMMMMVASRADGHADHEFDQGEAGLTDARESAGRAHDFSSR